MAAGDLKGTPLSVAQNSITNPTNATGSVAVVVGDLIYAVLFQQTALTVSDVTDNLGNTYNAANAGTDAGTTTGRAFWSRVTTAGTLTTVSFAATASANNVVAIAAVIEGPFVASPLDANPANIANDNATPYTCPATGTLAQASESVLCWICHTGNPTLTASSPNTIALQLATQAILKGAIGRQTVAATTSVAPEFTSSATPTDSCYGTTSFKLLVPITGTTAFTATGSFATAAAKVKIRSSTYGASGSLATVATVIQPPAAQAIGGGFGAHGELAYGQAVVEHFTFAVSTAFTGAGSLATTGAHTIPRATAFTADGDLATVATVTHHRTTAFSAVGTLVTAYTLSGTFNRTTAFTGAGSLVTAATYIPAAVLIPTAGGGFGAYGELAYGQATVPTAVIASSTAFTAAGSFATAAAHIIHRTMAVAASGSLATTASHVIHRATAFTASGSLATTSTRTAARSTAFAAVGSLATAASVSGTFSRTSTFSATGSLSTTASHVIHRTAAFSGTATLSTARIRVIHRSAAFSGVGTVSTLSTRTIHRTAAFTASGDLTTTASVGGLAQRTTEFTASGSFSTTATHVIHRTAAFTGVGVLTTNSVSTSRRTTAFSATGSLSTLYAPFTPKRFPTLGGVQRPAHVHRRSVPPIQRRPVPPMPRRAGNVS